MTLIIITGEIDLSVASIVGLSSVLLGVLHDDGMSIPAAALIVAAARRPCGAFNGFLVAVRRAAVARGHDRHPRALPGDRVGLLGTKAVTDFPETWTDLAIGHDRHPPPR